MMPLDEDAAPSRLVTESLSRENSVQESCTAMSTPRDSTSMSTEDAANPADEAGSWSGWAELENDPVFLYRPVEVG